MSSGPFWVNILDNTPSDKKEAKKTKPTVFWAWIYDLNVYSPEFESREACIDHCSAFLLKNRPKVAKTIKNPDKVGEWMQIVV